LLASEDESVDLSLHLALAPSLQKDASLVLELDQVLSNALFDLTFCASFSQPADRNTWFSEMQMQA